MKKIIKIMLGTNMFFSFVTKLLFHIVGITSLLAFIAIPTSFFLSKANPKYVLEKLENNDTSCEEVNDLILSNKLDLSSYYFGFTFNQKFPIFNTLKEYEIKSGYKFQCKEFVEKQRDQFCNSEDFKLNNPFVEKFSVEACLPEARKQANDLLDKLINDQENFVLLKKESNNTFYIESKKVIIDLNNLYLSKPKKVYIKDNSLLPYYYESCVGKLNSSNYPNYYGISNESCYYSRTKEESIDFVNYIKKKHKLIEVND